jgi:hypothetical protein
VLAQQRDVLKQLGGSGSSDVDDVAASFCLTSSRACSRRYAAA